MSAMGDVFELHWSEPGVSLSAQITEVAAGLRSLRVNGAAIVPEYPLREPRPFASGIILAPWANRLRDGRWVHDGVTQQLALTEPARSNAIHGLLRFSPYAVSARTESSITLVATIFPQSGYPVEMLNQVTYSLSAQGLSVQQQITNRGDHRAPVALGAHPFLTIPDVQPGEVVFTGPCASVIAVDERLLPVGIEAVAGEFDVRGGVRLDTVNFDHGFADPERDADGRAVHSLRADDGRTVSLWGDEAAQYWQVFTPGTYEGYPVAVAIEPMSAPADAFNSGDGVRFLEPGESCEMAWGIVAEGF